jgi:hypothetical protein
LAFHLRLQKDLERSDTGQHVADQDIGATPKRTDGGKRDFCFNIATLDNIPFSQVPKLPNNP